MRDPMNVVKMLVYTAGRLGHLDMGIWKVLVGPFIAHKFTFGPRGNGP